MKKKSQHLLLICCDYPPPLTTAGVTPSRLVRHLSEFGWHVSVISNSEQKFKSEVKKSQHNRPSVSRIGKKPYFDEWLPFGDNFHAVPSMVRNGIAKHAEQQVDAILACAAPVAACLAAGQLAHQIKVPVHHMQGDPWGPCDLRQPIRPFWTRLIEGAVEKRLSRRAASVILNTKTAKFAYLTAFPFLKSSSSACFAQSSRPKGDHR